MKDNKVYYLHFGKAIDKNEAKNDKYLNQIINIISLFYKPRKQIF